MLNCSQPALEKLLSGLKALDYTGYAEQYPPFGSWNTFKLSRKTLSDIWRGSLSDGIETGLYVNIPFCKIKCDFCFLPVTVTGPDETAIRGEFSSYFGLLKKEAGMLANIFSSASLKTLYIGGGTPSLMTPEEIGRLFSLLHSNFHFSPKAQVTTEIHPETADISVLKAFKSGGVNWLCIGAQSLNSGVLSKAGRRQDMGAVIRAYKNARRAGIEGINIDLICGLPGQTEKSFLKDVKIIADLRPDEIHLNTFIVTPYTLYGRRGGKPDAPEITERLKEKGFALLAAKGYKKLHYDSAGLGKNSKNFQTSDLKEKKSVLGLGPGAVSHAWGRARYINHVSWKTYRRRLLKNLPPPDRGCLIDKKEEMIYYALESLSNEPRKLDIGEFWKIFGTGFRTSFREELDMLKPAGVREGKKLLSAKKTNWNLLRGVFYEPRLLLEYARRIKTLTRAHSR